MGRFRGFRGDFKRSQSDLEFAGGLWIFRGVSVGLKGVQEDLRKFQGSHRRFKGYRGISWVVSEAFQGSQWHFRLCQGASGGLMGS